MTTGHPASASRARWTRERLVGLGLTTDQIVLSETTLPPLRSEADLTPTRYRPEFAPLVQRIARLLGTGRGVSVYVTGGRDATPTRVHAAVQLATGLAPLGRQVVLVDTEFLRPGLEGLLAEPLAEGVLDMVRFGRSSRALLQRPVPEGPWLMPSGSIPGEDSAPLDPDALRSVLYRISQVCDLALYVGPLPMRDEVHSMVRVCDHVLLASDESAVAPSEIVDALATLQAQHVHVLGAVLVAPVSEAASLPAMSPPPIPPNLPPLEALRPAAPMETPPIPSFAPVAPAYPVPTFDSLPVPPPPLWSEGGMEAPLRAWPPVSDLPALPESAAIPSAPKLPSFAEPLPSPSGLEPRIGLPPLEPEFDAAPAERSRQEAVFPEIPPARSEPEIAPFEPHTETRFEPEPASTSDRSWSEPRSSRSDLRSGRRRMDLPDPEFAFEDEAKFSRWPLVVVIVLLATIVFFVGSIFWLRQRPVKLPATQTETPLAGAQSDAAAGPDDSKAAQGSKPPGSTSPPPTSATQNPAGAKTPPSPPPTQSPIQPDDRAAAPQSKAPTGSASKPPVTREATADKSPVTPPAGAGSTGTGTTSPSPSRPPPAGSAPATSGAAPSGGAALPATSTEMVYSVHVASYQTLKKANEEIANLRARGYEGRAIETDLGSKGKWYRVYAGSYPTAAEAARTRDVLLKLPDYSFAQVKRLPRP